MPKDLVDDKTKFPAAVRVPVDGDEANGANFELPYQQLADRTAFLNEETIALGVRRIRRAASFAALRAITGMQQFDVRWVVGEGLYWYDPTSGGSEELPYAVKPATGVGLWLHVDLARRTEIERAFHPYNPFFVPPLETTVTTAWVDSGLAVTLRGANAGERVRAQLSADFRAEGSAGLYRVLITDGAGVATELPEMLFAMFASAGFQPRTVTGLHHLAASGDVTVKAQFRSSGATKTQIWGPATLLAELVRF